LVVGGTEFLVSVVQISWILGLTLKDQFQFPHPQAVAAWEMRMTLLEVQEVMGHLMLILRRMPETVEAEKVEGVVTHTCLPEVLEALMVLQMRWRRGERKLDDKYAVKRKEDEAESIGGGKVQVKLEKKRQMM
jgi:hypothetical protein